MLTSQIESLKKTNLARWYRDLGLLIGAASTEPIGNEVDEGFAAVGNDNWFIFSLCTFSLSTIGVRASGSTGFSVGFSVDFATASP